MVRSFSNRILGGVCGGLANATPLNAWLWRIFFAVLTLVTLGAGAVAYVLMWWILPMDSPIRRTYGGAVRGLLALLLSAGIVAAWFMRGNLIPTGVYWPVAFVTLAFVLFVKQIFARENGNVALGLVAMFVPTVFLLGALDVLPLGLYDILLRSMPAVLIFFGLSVLLRYRVPLGSWIALVLSVGLVVGLTSFAFNSRVDTKRDDKIVSIDESLAADVTLIQVNLNTEDTDVLLQVSDEARTITGEFRGSNNSNPNIAYSEDNTIATFTLREDQATDFPILEDMGRSDLVLQLPPDVAVAVAFIGDRGTMTFDMAELNLERLNIEAVNNGDVVITLPEYNPLSPSVRENPGTWNILNGDLRVVVPENVGARFLLNRSSNAEPRPDQTYDDLIYRVELEGNDYVLVSRQYDALQYQVEYRINLNNGRLTIDTPNAAADG